MVKPNYIPLKELNDQSKDIKVKVKVISKGDPKQTPPKRKYQKLLLKDEEGTTMDGTIFGNDIQMFEQAIVRNGEYEFSNVVVKPVPEAFRARAAVDYLINFNGNVRIIPLDLSGCSPEPLYRKLDKIPCSHSAEDDLIDVVGVVLFVGALRTIKHDEVENKVRDIIITDQSVIRPVKVSAWNECAEQDAGESTKFDDNANGEITNAVRSWVEEKKQFLEDWRDKAIQIYSESTNKAPKLLSDMERKKANSIWQDEIFWIQVSMSALETKEIHCYLGCSKCGKSSTDKLETKFICSNCHAKDDVVVKRALMNIIICDKTGTLKVTAFSNEVELIVGLKIDQIVELKQNENTAELDSKIAQLRKKKCFYRSHQAMPYSSTMCLNGLCEPSRFQMKKNNYYVSGFLKCSLNLWAV